MVNTGLTGRFTRAHSLGSYFFGLFLLLLSTALYAASLISEVDRKTVSLGESFELNVIFNQQTMFGEPDFSTLNKDFKILSRNRRSQYSNINGQTVTSTRWILNLSPLREGKLLIPSFTFKSEVSNAIELTVNKPKPSTQQTGQAVFTETLLEKPSVYAQEQALLTLRLYTSISMSNFTISELSVPGAQHIKVAESQYQKKIKGREYTVVETRYAIFADSSGTLTIPAIQYSGVIPSNNNRNRGSLFNQRGFSQRGNQAYYHTETKELSVKPIPSNTPFQYWLPGKKLELQEHWSNGASAITLGEPLTRTITITGQGLMGAQLPPLVMPSDKSYKLYPDQAQLDDSVSETGIMGSRIESIAIVPTQTGSITLPDITIDWWDTETNQARQSVLKGRTLEVIPAAGSIDNTEANSPQAANNETRPTLEPGKVVTNPAVNIPVWVLAGSNLLLLITTAIFSFLWWRNRRSTSSPKQSSDLKVTSDKAPFKNIRMACANNDYHALRQSIIDWARIHWHQDNLHSLEQIAELANNEELKNQFKALDANLYSKQNNQASVNTDTIFSLLENMRKNHSENDPDNERDRRQHLQPLYPTNT